MYYHGLIGIAVLIVSKVMLFLKVEPFVTWFYSFVWWGYILLADSIVYKRKGESLLLTRPKEFFWLIPWSVCFWLIFELFNLRIENWHYINLPANKLQRWAGYFVAYATVLPGLFETSELLESLGWFKNKTVKPLKITKRWIINFYILGILFLLLPLLFPRYGFPFVWLFFIFLLEPINYLYGSKSILKDWESGSFRRLYLLLTGGLLCGFLWEVWNFWAGAKWIYTVPYFNWLKIFEMPILGFLGFPPFAVECYVMYNFLNLSFQKSLLLRSKVIRVILIAILIIFYIFAFHSIDMHTVKSFI